MKTWLFFWICSLAWLGVLAQADTTSVSDSPKQAKAKKPFKIPAPSAIRIGLDASQIAFNVLNPEAQHYQANTELLLGNKWFVAMDLGLSRIRREGESGNFSLQTDGQYLLAGIDYNLLRRASRYDAGYVGVRYGYSGFSQTLNYSSGDSLWGEFTEQIVLQDLSAHWMELLGGLKVRAFSNFYLGAALRIKILLAKSDPALTNINDLPGYGTTKSSARLGFSLQLMYRFPLHPKWK